MKTPVLFLVFNRPDTTQQVFQAIRNAQPPRLYISADGARSNVKGEQEKVHLVRSYIMKHIDWQCEVKTLFREENLGCKRAVEEAISWFFEHEDEGIILEDDCLPTKAFFEFCEWGIEKYRNQTEVGMISGSNLIDYLSQSSQRNGFSMYISIWGWATWKERWAQYNPHLSFDDIKKLNQKLKSEKQLLWWERLFWRNVFKNTFGFASTWDFFLQFLFFEKKLFSVYPSQNLVKNLGFHVDGTHTTLSPPTYWEKSLPHVDSNPMSLPINNLVITDIQRDRLLARTIWKCTPLTAIRLTITNNIRYMKV